MECRTASNRRHCHCSYEPCSRKGLCCECLRSHLAARELPACCFPADVERTWDRSFETFARLVSERRV